MKARAFGGATLAAAAIVTLAACLGGEVGQAAPPGTVSGVISYAGPAAGPGRPLAIGVYRTFPPQGPPLRTALIEDYAFPYHFTFDGLEPGTYYVGALIDVDRTDRRYVGMLNPARDPYGYAEGGAPIVVSRLRGVAGLDVELEITP